ncbi:hypothetical protein [Novosphingobium sp.]|uniref:hypothetical protein n=1 Tax=Novosphingobium sp. TaxID=1874826 RepID=UPI0025CE6A8E|nr:hypothetical protein [Novosphingobium sp.]
MKSITFLTVSAVALLYAGTASAQSYPFPIAPGQSDSKVAASVDQTGSNNTSSISQDAGADQNTSVVVQGFSGANANSSHSTISQSGSGQRALTMQTNTNSANTNQTGANNDAFAYQTGSNNTAGITQSGSSSPSHTGNIGGVNGVGSTSGGTTLANSFANASELDLQQSEITTGLNAPSDAYTESAAYVVQASGANSNGATVNQSAAGTRAVVVQINNEAFSSANIIQAGKSADAFVHQDGGSFNNAGISQSGGGDTGLTAGIYQSGSTGGTASITQSNFNQIGFTYQTGTGNQSYTTQIGSNNQANTRQSGNNGVSYITQSGSNINFPVSGSTASVTQSGGTSNQSYLTQTGLTDTADVTQTGSYNISSVSQNIDSAWAHVGQTGTGNSSIISQGH